MSIWSQNLLSESWVHDYSYLMSTIMIFFFVSLIFLAILPVSASSNMLRPSKEGCSGCCHHCKICLYCCCDCRKIVKRTGRKF